jgi:hypothetical protein
MRSLLPSKENIQHVKTWNFFTFFIFLSCMGNFCPKWSGSSRPFEINFNADPSEFGSETLRKTIIYLIGVQITDFYLRDSHPNCWQLLGVHSSCSAPATVYIEICWSGSKTNSYCIYQCFGSGLIDSGSSILGWIPIRIRIRIEGFDDQKLRKNIKQKNLKFFWSKKWNLLIPRPP